MDVVDAMIRRKGWSMCLKPRGLVEIF